MSDDTTYTKLVCSCGHEGELVEATDGTGYAKRYWERWTVIGFIGEEIFSNDSKTCKSVLDSMCPKCPECGDYISYENIVKEQK
jgi:hypothetical protein